MFEPPDRLRETVMKLAEDGQSMREETERRKRQEIEDQAIEGAIRIISAAFENASRYTNLVIAAGYVTFFALWSATNPLLTARTAISAALLMILSAAVFVLFEVYKTIRYGIMFWKNHNLLVDESEPNRMQKWEALMRSQDFSFIKSTVLVWILTIPTAVLAIGILVWAYVARLLSG